MQQISFIVMINVILVRILYRNFDVCPKNSR
ncbi:hypothetical protein VSVS12_03955 [Vibrio scophthalmi]|nr:hypothetical protein VSVS12_03955 [Vibrio scophthalmi]